MAPILWQKLGDRLEDEVPQVPLNSQGLESFTFRIQTAILGESSIFDQAMIGRSSLRVTHRHINIL